MGRGRVGKDNIKRDQLDYAVYGMGSAHMWPLPQLRMLYSAVVPNGRKTAQHEVMFKLQLIAPPPKTQCASVSAV